MPLKLVAARFPKTLAGTRAMATELNPLCDILFVPKLQGIRDDNGISLTNKQAVPGLSTPRLRTQ
nr:hypothetical protein [uncultured Desulfobacter sp.]